MLRIMNYRRDFIRIGQCPILVYIEFINLLPDVLFH